MGPGPFGDTSFARDGSVATALRSAPAQNVPDAPHRIATYALETAQTFTAFYRDCRVVGAEPAELESFRLALCVATRRVLARALGLLGVTAPDSM